MNIRPIVSLVAAGVVAAGAVVTAHAIGGAGPSASTPGNGGSSEFGGHWVDSWVSMPQLTEPGNLPPAPFMQDNLAFANSTVRQTIHLSVGGHRMRLRFSNAFGGVALPITSVNVALPVNGAAGVSAIQPATLRPVTFHGQPSVSIPVGSQVVSDPLNFDLVAQSNLTVTIYLAEGQASNNITSHPGSRTSTYMVNGNQITAADLPGAANVFHWYFVSGLEVLSGNDTAGVVMLGDSLTDGRGSTNNLNDRWPDRLLARLQSQRSTSDIAVLNEAAGGNRILNDGLGPNALARLDRDVLAQSGIRWMIVFEGVNDIGTADTTQAAQDKVTADLIAAYDQIITRAHAQGIRVYGATITPFGGNNPYDDPAGLREAARQNVNTWIRTSREFDSVIDLDRVARDPANPRQLLPSIDVGDHLHFNPAGYQTLADAVPARLFR